MTETLIAAGFDNVRAVHTANAIKNNTIKGLLQDQEKALEMLFAHVKDDR
ncbi:MAG: hypothetical protein OXC63_08485 [Aestuariivita sp.]|nr:hypothetical protein [Aestuariivita sp.]